SCRFRVCDFSLFVVFSSVSIFYLCFFFNDPSTSLIYTLSLHDALPIFGSSTYVSPAVLHSSQAWVFRLVGRRLPMTSRTSPAPRDRKSTRLNSSHQIISYAVFCLKKKKEQI